MRLLMSLLLLASSLSVSAQSIEFKLAGGSQRKWVGENVFTTDAHENNAVYIFEKNHLLQTNAPKPKKTKEKLTWGIERGVDIHDAIVMRLGKKLYNVEFTKTTNGKDMMVLTNVPATDEDDILVRTFVAE